MGSFWHPFAQMGKVDGEAFAIDRADGVYVYDEAGNAYLDGTAALWFCNVGYGRAEIADAVDEQIRKLHAFHTFGDFSNRPAERLADRVASIAPMPGSKVFLTSGGSDSVDTAAKLARRYFHEIGQSQRNVFIIREWGYHGMHAYGTSFSGMAPNLEGHGPLIGDVVRVTWDSVEALERAIDDVGPDRVAGLVCEPVIGAGGVRFPPDGYLKSVQQLVHDAGGFFISDEVITGFGRVGAWFAATRFGLEPDLITFAKGVTSGYLPVGGVIAAAHVAEPFWDPDSEVMWRHGYTYSGHATAAAAGLANLAILEDEGLVERALALETDLVEALGVVVEHPLVSDLRTGPGFLAGVQLDEAALQRNPDLASDVARSCRAEGLITRVIGGGGLQVSPPLTISKDQLAELADCMRRGIEAVA
jgi:adenosylmethionine-8-amino-7-oxononanoate aminotransferase